jgi:hypothetical protein
MLVTILLLLAPVLFIRILPIVRCLRREFFLLALSFIGGAGRWRMIMAIVDWCDVGSNILIVCGK